VTNVFPQDYVLSERLGRIAAREYATVIASRSTEDLEKNQERLDKAMVELLKGFPPKKK
jgi:hypothetical protein